MFSLLYYLRYFTTGVSLCQGFFLAFTLRTWNNLFPVGENHTRDLWAYPARTSAFTTPEVALSLARNSSNGILISAVSAATVTMAQPPVGMF